MILFLDTSAFEEVHFAVIGSTVLQQRVKLKRSNSEKTLLLLERFLKKNKVRLQAETFKRIVVVSGPGSFTGIRTGVAIALAFSLAFDIHAYAIKKDKLPQSLLSLNETKNLKKINSAFNPNYGAEPNITPSRKR